MIISIRVTSCPRLTTHVLTGLQRLNTKGPAMITRNRMITNGRAGYGNKLRGPKGRKTKVPDEKERRIIRWIVAQRNAR